MTIRVPDFQALYFYLAPLNDSEVLIFGGSQKYTNKTISNDITIINAKYDSKKPERCPLSLNELSLPEEFSTE